MTTTKAAITVNRPLDEVRRLWESSEPGRVKDAGASVSFAVAPGDRGTEIHVSLTGDAAPSGKLASVARKVKGDDPIAKVKDELRHFKQRVETGEVPRSDATPEGESLERKLKQRPARPLTDDEREKVGV